MYAEDVYARPIAPSCAPYAYNKNKIIVRFTSKCGSHVVGWPVGRCGWSRCWCRRRGSVAGNWNCIRIVTSFRRADAPCRCCSCVGAPLDVWPLRLMPEKNDFFIHASSILCNFSRMWQCIELSASFLFDTRPARPNTIRVRTIYASKLILFRSHVIWFWCVAHLVSCLRRRHNSIRMKNAVWCIPFSPRLAAPVDSVFNVGCESVSLWRDWMPKWCARFIYLFVCTFDSHRFFLPVSQRAQQATAIGVCFLFPLFCTS